jgi:hypothetical protein
MGVEWVTGPGRRIELRTVPKDVSRFFRVRPGLGTHPHADQSIHRSGGSLSGQLNPRCRVGSAARRYRAPMDVMPQPGDRYAQAFTVEPGQCWGFACAPCCTEQSQVARCRSTRGAPRFRQAADAPRVGGSDRSRPNRLGRGRVAPGPTAVAVTNPQVTRLGKQGLSPAHSRDDGSAPAAIAGGGYGAVPIT